ncbi:EpsG family protein [Paenibacillus antri]|uniref:EpsG family protein n=1 Tax=Paenibacillus antri TaxID=2582848 RepID=A0A5R9G0U6_9BACL|nr:EpsG family protein [Paenibacillus antri]TLS49401.1 EpsG family protein [Paenibacillus antri]
MTILYMNLAAVYLLAFMSRYLSTRTAIGPAGIRPSYYFGLLAAASLCLVSGLRRNIGDTFFYMHSYVVEDFSLENLSLSGDFGFTILQALLHRITDDPQILIFVTGVATNALIVVVLLKYSRMIELALFVYIASGMFTVSMNGIRQYLAAAIIFAGLKYVLNGDWKKYFCIVLFASTFHKTALILLPIYFLVRREAWTKMTLMLLGVAVMLALGFNLVSNILFAALGDTKYSVYSEFNEGGANVIRLAVNMVPIVIAYLGRHKLRQLWPKSDYIVNLALLSNVIMLIATQNWIFARLNIYFDLYNLILISWGVKLFVEKHRSLIYYGMIAFYAVYFFFEHDIILNLHYQSDYIRF